MQDLFSYTQTIQERIKQIITTHRSQLEEINPWGKDALDRLIIFATKGKLLRGNCIVLSYTFAKGKNVSQAITLGAILEIVHTSLLIHDDIMDNDIKRRGDDSIFFQYQKLLDKQAENNGKSLAMCVGDLGFFLAYSALSTINSTNTVLPIMLQKLASELAAVTLGQMQDIALYPSQKLSEETILQTYRYKTARYTFSLPFALGTILAKSIALLKPLEEYGELLGLIFQIKDDEVGMFGTEEEIGKPIGSDIREGKKTLYYFFLMHNASEKERIILEKIFGNPEITSADIVYVHQLLIKYGIDQKVATIVSNYKIQLEQLIIKLPLEKNEKEQLELLLTFSLHRKK